MGRPKLDLWPLLEQLTFKTKSAKLVKFDRNAPFAWAPKNSAAEGKPRRRMLPKTPGSSAPGTGTTTTWTRPPGSVP